MSAGIRSGVNWTRFARRPNVSPRVVTSSVSRVPVRPQEVRVRVERLHQDTLNNLVLSDNDLLEAAWILANAAQNSLVLPQLSDHRKHSQGSWRVSRIAPSAGGWCLVDALSENTRSRPRACAEAVIRLPRRRDFAMLRRRQSPDDRLRLARRLDHPSCRDFAFRLACVFGKRFRGLNFRLDT